MKPLLIVFVAGVIMAVGPSGFAQSPPSTALSYTVRYEPISDSCAAGQGTPITPANGLLKMQITGTALVVQVGGLPRLAGETLRNGKFKAETRDTTLRVKYSAVGRMIGTRLQMSLVVEYYKNDQRPECTKSWDATGSRA